jgi:hypothetical protein
MHEQKPPNLAAFVLTFCCDAVDVSQDFLLDI